METTSDTGSYQTGTEPNSEPHKDTAVVTTNLVNLTSGDDSARDPPVWWEPHARREPEPRVLRQITCFNNLGKSEFLPAISVTNVRSLGPKFKSFTQDFRMKEISIACITETWGKDDKLHYRKNILSLLRSILLLRGFSCNLPFAEFKPNMTIFRKSYIKRLLE